VLVLYVSCALRTQVISSWFCGFFSLGFCVIHIFLRFCVFVCLFFVLGFVFSVLAKILAGKGISEMAHFVLSRT